MYRFIVFLSFLLVENTFASSSTISKLTGGNQTFTIINLDSDELFLIDDEDVQSIMISVTSSPIKFSPTPSEIGFYIHKCGELIFNGTATTRSRNELIFTGNWVSLILNGTNGACDSNSPRQLLIIVDTEENSSVNFGFEKVTHKLPTEYISKSPMVQNVSFNQNQKVFLNLTGLLVLNDSPDLKLPIHISSNQGITIEIGVCNATFLTINENKMFSRELTRNESSILHMMKNVRCQNPWYGDNTRYFVRLLESTAPDAYFVIEAKPDFDETLFGFKKSLDVVL